MFKPMISTKLKKKGTVLFYDGLKAHGVYGKKMLKSKEAYDYDFVIHEISKIENIGDYLVSNNVAIAVLFIYGKDRLYELLPFLNREINLILCTDPVEVKWLQHNFPEIVMLDIDLPKTELFYQIETHILRFRKDREKEGKVWHR
ncbi:hypothetical protein FGF1_28910 [Flavobacteriaceae bacterium GF1]